MYYNYRKVSLDLTHHHKPSWPPPAPNAAQVTPSAAPAVDNSRLRAGPTVATTGSAGAQLKPVLVTDL